MPFTSSIDNMPFLSSPSTISGKSKLHSLWSGTTSSEHRCAARTNCSKDCFGLSSDTKRPSAAGPLCGITGVAGFCGVIPGVFAGVMSLGFPGVASRPMTLGGWLAPETCGGCGINVASLKLPRAVGVFRSHVSRRSWLANASFHHALKPMNSTMRLTMSIGTKNTNVQVETPTASTSSETPRHRKNSRSSAATRRFSDRNS
mmetsp:Transcript_76939/g.152341  ORF Transcript_76939/g.152341 Transcript_76939/m.152341 type:complete len:202 (+) Transcript_76939:657-1262(+)